VLNKALDMADHRYHFANEALRYEAEKTNKNTLTAAPDNRVEEANGNCIKTLSIC
jgi:hypothetical protein